MKLNRLSEARVDTARKDIVQICNDIASLIARSAEVIFGGDRQLRKLLHFTHPEVIYSDSESEPATVTLRIVSETLSLTVYGDGLGQVKLEMSEKLAKLLGTKRIRSISSLEETDKILSGIITIIKSKFNK